MQYFAGKRRITEDVAGWLADLVRARLETGRALLVELEAVAAREPVERLRQRRAGIAAVDPSTGLSARGRVGKRRDVAGV